MNEVETIIQFCDDLENNLDRELDQFINEDQPGADIVIGATAVIRAIRVTLEQAGKEDEQTGG